MKKNCLAKKMGGKTVAKLNGEYIHKDGKPSDPLNKKRTVNTVLFTTDLLEAKDFNVFPEDIPTTQAANSQIRFYIANFTTIGDGTKWQLFVDTRYSRPE